MKIKNEPLFESLAPKETQLFDNRGLLPSPHPLTAQAAEACEADYLNAEAYLHWAELLARQGMYKEAAQVCAKGISIKPFDGRLQYGKGIMYLKLGRINEAAAAFSMAVRLDTEIYTYRIGKGISHLLMGMNDAASDTLLRARWLGGEDADKRCLVADWRWLALMLSGRGKEMAGELEDIDPDLGIRRNADCLKVCLMYKGRLTPDEVLAWLDGDRDNEETRNGSGYYGVAQYLISNGESDAGWALMRRCAEKENWALSTIAARRVLYVARAMRSEKAANQGIQ